MTNLNFFKCKNLHICNFVFSLLLVCGLMFGFSVEAKTYTNTEYQFSLWVPDGMEVYNSGSFKLDNGDNVDVIKGELYGLNMEISVMNVPNVDGQDFSSLNFIKGYMEATRNVDLLFGNTNVLYYYNNPCPNHYYPVIVRDISQKDFASGETNIEIHRYCYLITINGANKYKGVIKQILDSFTCLRE
ncbi:MAG: hypothetical protein KBS60_02460 [Phascolarctobacterium sp.]|nr:hypothetical protein [Candidatus Phascolarctobacterium caballi]